MIIARATIFDCQPTATSNQFLSWLQYRDLHATVCLSVVRTGVLPVTDERPKSVVEIQNGSAAGAEPGHVSVYIDGDRRFIVRTSDLENIGFRLRGRRQFSVFNSIGLPILISLLTVVGTTTIGQVIQYVSWRNSTKLQTADNSGRTRSRHVPESIDCSQQAILRDVSSILLPHAIW